MIDETNVRLLIAALLIGIPLGVAAMGWSGRRMRAMKKAWAGPTASFRMTCNVCERPIEFSPKALGTPSLNEIALTVRARPAVVGKKLGEYPCPHCGSAHCFIINGPRIEWVGVNLYKPQERSAHCYDCRKLLAQPPGEPGNSIEDLPDPDPDVGLECPHCKAVCCLSCCRNATRNRTRDGALLCPRCFRRPMSRLFHPQDPQSA